MEVSATGYVILGMLGRGPMSGYEIKSLVDRSTRFFWAASYGQIYPELRRLAAGGLIAGEARPTGGRKRTVYRLTQAGRRELRGWLANEPRVYETRNEALLKLFFADAGAAGTAAATLQAMGDHAAQIAARLREIERSDPGKGADGGSDHLVLRFGIEVNEWIAAWCAEAGAAQPGAEAQRRSA